LYLHSRSSVAHLTRADDEEFVALAPKMPVRITTTPFPLGESNEAPAALREGRVEARQCWCRENRGRDAPGTAQRRNYRMDKRAGCGTMPTARNTRILGETMSRLPALLIVIVLGGCGTDSGTKIDSSQLAQFTVGQTTYNQVAASLGTPSTLQTRSDGSRTAAYSHLSASPRAATFIPIVGAFAGGADVHSETVVFQFDRRGVLTDYTTSQTQACSGTGVFSDVNAANCNKR
jgi:outer membrane protein assembly factor BamE (lipoprotein component of BamABCDE complex)